MWDKQVHMIIFVTTAQKRSLPISILCDNFSEFTYREQDRWAYENNVSLDFFTTRQVYEKWLY